MTAAAVRLQLKKQHPPLWTRTRSPRAIIVAGAMSKKGYVQRQGADPSVRDLPGAAVGIDLGTTYSVVAGCREGRVEIFANAHGKRTTPSVVGFLNGESCVGDAAADLPAANQVFDAKRLIGRPWRDLHVQKDRAVWPFELVEQAGVPRIRVDVGGKLETFAPEEISAMVLRDLKKTAEDALGQTVSKAVVTVPAFFNERQRQATKDACKIAGMEVLSVISEPTAAALAHGLHKDTAKSPKTVFIFDLGGGTFDVSIVRISGCEFTVLAAGGTTDLGGQNFDEVLIAHCIKDAKRQLNANLTEDKQAVQDLRKACELAKRRLSNMPQVTISVFFTPLCKIYQTTVTRALFEDLCAPLFSTTIAVGEEVLADAQLAPADIDEVVLVGGSTRIPKVRALLRNMFGNGKVLRLSINPDEAVAHGAALHAAKVVGDKVVDGVVKLRDATPLSLGIEISGDRFSTLIKRNTPIPCRSTGKYCNSLDNQTAIQIKLYQGVRPLVTDNCYLNKDFNIEVPPKPKGQAIIDVTFELDESGLLLVTAADPTTGRQAQVQVSAQEAYLSNDDIQAMIKRAGRFRREDQEALLAAQNV
ncbi:heat shock 70 kDa protein II-like [Frankliniella occidentalis]|uniref:Heat shock 70 kDa protein II-like n=1 Tax=Frankliniella occidentalis TaxID=133901 RepID=A0A6J1STF6_FRAOC|nr:heat shock 70 kDa protein II-like [Frankliniella occidentalis]